MTSLFATDASFTRVSERLLDELGASVPHKTTPAPPQGSTRCAETDLACREEACLAELHDLVRIQKVVTETLGTAASCATTSSPRQIPQDGDHYYLADLECTLVNAPSATRVAGFTANMETRGFYGYQLIEVSGSTPIVTAQTTTPVCSSF
jgi:hypothetical protein